MKKKQGLKQRIKTYLDKCGCWVHKGKLEEVGQAAGYMGDYVARELRHLKEDGEIMGKENENGSMIYRSLTPLHKTDIWRTLPDGSRELIKTVYE
jgi:hypothetical protein